MGAQRLGLVAAVLALLGVTCSAAFAAGGYATEHVFIVVMDGVRWMDTFGDETHQFVPHLYNDLRPQGTLFTNYFDRGITVTRQGHSTLISGTWQKVTNGGPRLTRPTLFEYCRDEKDVPETKCWSVFGKARYSFEPYSSHPAYGKRYAGSHVNGGGPDNPINENGPEGDAAVLDKVIQVMKADQPDIVFVNFGYTDHAGHVATDISEYQAAIRNCDEQMWKLWEAIQADPNYRDKTTVFFTNDHGRHTNDFHSHGDHCDGCEHIMLLVLGPDIKKGAVVEQEALQIDVAPTAAELLRFQTPLATGRVLAECLTQYLGLNTKETKTYKAKKAVVMEELASRDLVKTAADRVLAVTKPRDLAADFGGETLARGMVRAYKDTNDSRYLDFVQRWIDAQATLDHWAAWVALGDTILDLPQQPREKRMALARELGDKCLGVHAVTNPRQVCLAVGAFLGQLGEVTKQANYTDAGLALVTAALAKEPSEAPSPLVSARELAVLGQAAACFADDNTVMGTFVAETFSALGGIEEAGAFWEDPTVSVLNLYGIQASKRRSALKAFVQIKGQQEEEKIPPCVQAMPEEQLRALFPDRPKAPLANLQRQLVNAVVLGAKQYLGFSQDMLRYGVDKDGVYADGSPAAQGGFLLAYQKLDWRYGGNTWPGPAPKPPPQG